LKNNTPCWPPKYRVYKKCRQLDERLNQQISDVNLRIVLAADFPFSLSPLQCPMKKTPSLSLWIYVSRRSPISDHLAYTILVSFLLSPSHFNHSYIHTYIHLHMKYTCICIIPISMWHITYSQTPTFTFGSLQCFSFLKDPRILYESRKRVYFPCPQSHTHTLRDSGVG